MTKMTISHIICGTRRDYILRNSIIQWVLFFFIYCFIGWVWETTYVSLRKRKFTNRGFMNGPVLPIYGFGALTILFVTIPVHTSKILTFVVGMIGATVLEYMTGVVMEALFKVRYWDYSNQRFNYKGHICLSSSIAWGFASVLIVNVIQVPIAMLVKEIPRLVQESMTVILTVCATFDMAMSVRDALDIKELLMNIKQNNEEMQKLQKRLDVLIAVLDDETQNLKHKIEQMVESRQDEENGYFGRKLENIKKRFEEVERVAGQFDWKVKGMQRNEVKTEFEGMKEKLLVSITKRDLRKVRLRKHTGRLLRRNPHAVSKEYAAELNEVKNLKNNR